MKKFFKKVFLYIKDLFKRFPELLSIPAALIVWIFSITVLRILDPTSAVYDAGVFQIPIFAVLQLFVYVAIAWLLLGLVFGTAKKFLRFNFKNAFEDLTSWQKIILAYGLFFSLVFALVALSYTLH